MKRIMICLIGIFLIAYQSTSFAEIVRVVYQKDGSVSVIYPAPGVKKEGETDQEWRKRVFEDAMVGPLKGLPYTEIDSSELPNRKYRDAWVGSGTGVTIDSNKAAAIDLKNTQLKVNSQDLPTIKK